ncbi:hypothetical protein [Pseudotabrizicola algicola]|uniref:Uncharacterized protein n=1 Tax=Pseudotabrizicola algicola TaxID=2709381 RepID=A0A6B3RIF9_9RHOB|nr:hypothetical protein [Pseudotabrizicola algicola]NEX45201.1 hypothetical protein [Pseudotabrizicola algicola]
MSRSACPSFWNNFRAFRRHTVGLSRKERAKMAALLRLGPLALLCGVAAAFCTEDEARRRIGL